MPKNNNMKAPVTGTSQDDFIDQNSATSSQQINAGDGNDTVIGGYYVDRVNAGDGDDMVTGAEGNDILFGNDGIDTAVYRGSILDFIWADAQGNALEMTDLNTADGDEGTDTLKHFEYLKFDDYTYNLGGVNAAHVVAEAQTSDEDNALTFSVKAWDFDGGEVSVQSMTISGGGTISVQSFTAAASGMGAGKEFTIEFDPGDHYQHLAVGESMVEEVELVVSDGQGNLTTQTFQLTIEGRNDAPVIGGITYDPGSLKEDEVLTVTGAVDATDLDASDTLSYGLPDGPAGAYGTLTLDPATGAWSYKLNNAHPAVQALAVNESLIEEFAVEVSDGNGGTDTATISLQIDGNNDAPEISEVTYDTNTLQEDGTQAAAGMVVAGDVDTNDVLTFSGGGAGTYGTLTLDPNTGAWSYQLANSSPAVQALSTGQAVLEEFVVEVSDGNGGTDTETISLSIAGSNDGPQVDEVVNNNTVVQEDTTLQGTGQVLASDIDQADTLGYAVQGSGQGAYGSLAVDTATGVWTYTLNNANPLVQSLAANQSVIENFSVEVSDGNGGSATTQVAVEVRGFNDDPVAQDQVIVIDQLGNGDFAASPDFDGWTVSTGTTGLTWTYSSSAYIDRSGYALTNGDDAVAILDFTGEVPQGYGTGYGPTITSDPFTGQAGDAVRFSYELSSGGDQAIGTGYIRDANTGAIVQTVFNYQVPFSGSTGLKNVELTLAQSGQFVIDFRVGSYDATGGLYVGAKLEIGEAGIVRSGLSEDDSYTFAGANFLAGATDVDNGDTLSLDSVAGTSVLGASLSLGTDGKVTYQAGGNLDYLSAGEVVVDTFEFTITDGNGGYDTATASIEVRGVNDDPVIASVDYDSSVVREDGVLTASGVVKASDVDRSDTLSYSVTGGGTYGSLSIDSSGTWQYTLNNSSSAVQGLNAGQTVQDSFTVKVSDGNGGTATETVSISVEGAQDGVLLTFNNAQGNNLYQEDGFEFYSRYPSQYAHVHYGGNSSDPNLSTHAGYATDPIRLQRTDGATFDLLELDLEYLTGTGYFQGSNGATFGYSSVSHLNFGNTFDNVAWVDWVSNAGSSQIDNVLVA